METGESHEESAQGKVDLAHAAFTRVNPLHVLQELNKLRAAVACHPHALARLLEESYGQRGNLRWQRLQVGLISRRSSQSIHLPFK